MAMSSSGQEQQRSGVSSRPTSALSGGVDLTSVSRASSRVSTDWQSIIANSDAEPFNPLLNASLPAGAFDPVHSDTPPDTSFDLLQIGAIRTHSSNLLQNTSTRVNSNSNMHTHAHPATALDSSQPNTSHHDTEGLSKSQNHSLSELSESSTQIDCNNQPQNNNFGSCPGDSDQSLALPNNNFSVPQPGVGQSQHTPSLQATLNGQPQSTLPTYNPFSDPDMPFPLPGTQLPDFDENGNMVGDLQLDFATDGVHDESINTSSLGGQGNPGFNHEASYGMDDPQDTELGAYDYAINEGGSQGDTYDESVEFFDNAYESDPQNFEGASRNEEGDTFDYNGHGDYISTEEETSSAGHATYANFDFADMLQAAADSSSNKSNLKKSDRSDEDHSNLFKGYNVFDYAGSPFESGIVHSESFGGHFQLDEVNGDNDFGGYMGADPRRSGQFTGDGGVGGIHQPSHPNEAVPDNFVMADGDNGPHNYNLSNDLIMHDNNHIPNDNGEIRPEGGMGAIGDSVMGAGYDVSNTNGGSDLTLGPDNSRDFGGFGEPDPSDRPNELGVNNHFEGFSEVCFDPARHPHSPGGSENSDATLVPLNGEAETPNLDQTALTGLKENKDDNLESLCHRMIERAQKNIERNIPTNNDEDPEEVIQIHQHALDVLETSRGAASADVRNALTSILIPRPPIAPDFDALAISILGKAHEVGNGVILYKDLCAFCHYDCDFGVLNESFLLPAEASPHFCADCRASTSAFSEMFSAMGYSHELDTAPIPLPLDEALDNDEIQELAKSYQRSIPRPHNTISQFDGRNIEQFRGILFCRGSPYRQIDLEQTKICADCSKEKLDIIKHGHGGYESIILNGENVDPTEIPNHKQLKDKRCMICPSQATQKCKGCPLRLCDHCHTILTNICGDRLDNLFYYYNKKHIRNDAFLLRSDGGGY